VLSVAVVLSAAVVGSVTDCQTNYPPLRVSLSVSGNVDHTILIEASASSTPKIIPPMIPPERRATNRQIPWLVLSARRVRGASRRRESGASGKAGNGEVGAPRAVVAVLDQDDDALIYMLRTKIETLPLLKTPLNAPMRIVYSCNDATRHGYNPKGIL
jgi:hypothetical protein